MFDKGFHSHDVWIYVHSLMNEFLLLEQVNFHFSFPTVAL